MIEIKKIWNLNKLLPFRKEVEAIEMIIRKGMEYLPISCFILHPDVFRNETLKNLIKPGIIRIRTKLKRTVS